MHGRQLAPSLHFGGIRRNAYARSRRLVTRRSRVQILARYRERHSGTGLSSAGSECARDGEPNPVPGVIDVALQVPDPLGTLGLGARSRVPGSHCELVWARAKFEVGLPEPP